VDSLLQRDEYQVLADYQSYIDRQEQVGQAFFDSEHWTKMSILNVARMGYFSSDRSIQEYCDQIWKVNPVKVEIN
jgi:starch phosphorylase